MQLHGDRVTDVGLRGGSRPEVKGGSAQLGKDMNGGYCGRHATTLLHITSSVSSTMGSLGRCGGEARLTMCRTSASHVMVQPPLYGGLLRRPIRDTPGVRIAWDRGLPGTTDGPSCHCTFSRNPYAPLRQNGADPAYLLWSCNPHRTCKYARCADSAKPALRISSVGVRRWVWYGKPLPWGRHHPPLGTPF